MEGQGLTVHPCLLAGMAGVDHHNHKLSYDELRTHVSRPRHELRCLEQAYTYIRAREHGKPCVFVWQVSRAEAQATLCDVVMPFFFRSRQLLSAVWPGAGQVMQWHQEDADPQVGCPDKPAGQQYRVGDGECWLQMPGLVRLDPRGKKKRKEIESACVYPAAASKLHFQSDRYVRHHVVGGYYEVQLYVAAKVVGREGARGWVAVSRSAVRRVHLAMQLHQLIFYLVKGYTGLRSIPFGQGDVLVHLGECKGCCCCPWHLKRASKRENAFRAIRFRGRKGINNNIDYAADPEGM